MLQPATSQARLHGVPGQTSRYVCSVGRRADICSLKGLDGEVHLNLSEEGMYRETEIIFQSGMNLNQESCMTAHKSRALQINMCICTLYMQYIVNLSLAIFTQLLKQIC